MTNIFKETIAETIFKTTNIDKTEILSWIEIPKDKNMGDYALPCFRLSRHLKKNPKLIAEELKDVFNDQSFFNEINAVNGFLNFTISPQALVSDFFDKRKNLNDIAKIEEGEGKTVIVEFSSPNIAKPFGVGHLRSTVIGHCIANLYENCGYRVLRINHLGDWGTQFGKLITSYLKWGNEDELKKSPIHYLYQLYVKFHKEAEKDDQLNQEARDWFKKMENGDERAMKIWREFKDLSLEEFKNIYNRLGVRFDYYTGESFYSDQLDECVDSIVSKGITEESEGALIVNLEEYDFPPCLLRKQDGATLYATRDLRAAIYRKEKYDFHENIYVVGSGQKLHFQQIFKVLELMGYDWARNCIHVPFGMILGISTRKGTLVFLEDILNEARDRAVEIMKDRSDHIDDIEETADKIAVSAIIFQDLSNRRIKDFEFNLDRMISFDGDTGPYLQYTLVRIASILRKISGKNNFSTKELVRNFQEKMDREDITNDEALDLIKIIEQYETYLLSAKNQREPSILTNYLIDLAYHFNRFYKTNRVILEGQSYSNARASLLCYLYEYLKKGMEIIGLYTLDRM